jgi:chemotaxis protein histidine kinase CheA
MGDSDSDSDSDYSQNGEDKKMQALLSEWDDKDAAKEVYADSDDSDEENDEAFRKKAALLKSSAAESSEEEESDEEESEEEEESDEEESEEEESSEEEEEVKPKSKKEKAKADKEKEKAKEKAAKDQEKEKAKKSKSKPKKVEKEEEEEEEEDDESESDSDEEIIDTLKKKPKKQKEKRSKSKRITDANDDDDDEDIAMKKLLGDWDADNGDDSEDDESEEEEDDESVESEASERIVELNDNVLDHIVLAAPDLDEAIKEFETKTGLAPVVAGTIKGLGIRCARVSFSDATYLEIIAPDPSGPGPIGELLKNKKITELTPFHYAIRTREAEALKDEVGKFGYTPDHITMFGAKKDGTPKKWEMLYLYGHKLGGICPFFINWANSDHPCTTLPVVGNLKKFTIRAPADDPVHKLFDHISVEGIKIEEGSAKMSIQFKSPEGTIKYESKKAVGFKFPGFETENGAIEGDDGEQDAEVVFENPTLPDLLVVSDEEYDFESSDV